MNHHRTPSPTDLPGQSGITHHIPVPLPAPSVELFEDVTGRRWRLAEDGTEGRLFVPEELDPADCLRAFWLRESALRAFAGDLTRVERAA